jgi:hypothetical protein
VAGFGQKKLNTADLVTQKAPLEVHAIAMMASFIVTLGLASSIAFADDVVQKDIFSQTVTLQLAPGSPTNGSDRGFARSNLTRLH